MIVLKEDDIYINILLVELQAQVGIPELVVGGDEEGIDVNLLPPDIYAFTGTVEIHASSD